MADLPTRRDILAWIRAEYPKVHGEKARTWAQALTGLRWEHLKPIVAVSASTGTPPALAMAAAAAYTEDSGTERALREHLDRL